MEEGSIAQRRVGVVMAGGSGERFWPLSTGDTPKQLLNLTHPTKSMLQEAIERLEGVTDDAFVSTSRSLAGAIEKSGLVLPEHVLAEPSKRNTLGALVWVVSELITKGLGEAVVAVVTADHFIGKVDRFQSAVGFALDYAEEIESFVTFGITPTRPETGYGYIEISGDGVNESDDWQAFQANAFREKPDAATAKSYLSSGRHLWNSGMFFFSIPTFLRELKSVQPEASAALEGIVTCLKSGDGVGAEAHFAQVPNVSIDYGVMEKVEKVYTIPVDFPWDDVGSWDALERTGEELLEGNAVRGNPILIDVRDSIVVQGDPEIQVTLLGVRDLIVVSTSGAVLVCDKSQAQRVREIARLIAKR
jgi:mannose-1-phosphate guanylyltransferase